MNKYLLDTNICVFYFRENVIVRNKFSLPTIPVILLESPA